MKLNIGCGPLWKLKHPDADGVDLRTLVKEKGLKPEGRKREDYLKALKA